MVGLSTLAKEQKQIEIVLWAEFLKTQDIFIAIC
jgi:hypothetical protein